MALAALLTYVLVSPSPGYRTPVSIAANSAAADSGRLVTLTPAAALSASAGAPSATQTQLTASASASASTSPATAKQPTTKAAVVPAKAAPSTAAPSPDPAPPTVNVTVADSSDGYVLDVDNSGTSVGTLIGTWPSDNTAAQRWHLVLQPSGGYVLYSELMDLSEGLDININPSNYSGNTITTMQSYNSNSDMRWTAVYAGSGKYQLKNSYNGQCLQGAGQGVANATTACNTSNAHQLWTIAS